MMCGVNTWNEIELFGKSKIIWLRTILELPNGISSHDKFNRVFSRLNPKRKETPVQGAGNFIVNFLKPRYTGGILVEFVESLA